MVSSCLIEGVTYVLRKIEENKKHHNFNLLIIIIYYYYLFLKKIFIRMSAIWLVNSGASQNMV